MQETLKALLAELHESYFKPNGWKKTRQRFRREVDGVLQEIEFQSSQWNRRDGPLTFYVNVSVGFADIPFKGGAPALTGEGRIKALVNAAPSQFGLTEANCAEVRTTLLSLVPAALDELPKHYEEVRRRARDGFHCFFTAPDSPES